MNYPAPPHLIPLCERVRAVLTEDLLYPKSRKQPRYHPMQGFCYVASEAIFHLCGGRSSFFGLRWGTVPVSNAEAITHFWLVDLGTQEVCDPTGDQAQVDYTQGKSCGFLTRGPSKRAREVIKRLSF